MEVDPWFWAYAALHRLGTMIAGVVFVSLGFLLFRQKVRAATDLNLSLGDRQLNLSTTAPGTCFALLGAGVICTMLFQGNPTYEGIGPDGKTFRVTKGPALTEPAAGPVNRGETHSGFLAAYQRGLEQRKEGDDEAALEALSEALAIKDATLEQAAGPLREVAEIYLEQGRSAEALPLARIRDRIRRRQSSLSQHPGASPPRSESGGGSPGSCEAGARAFGQ